MLKENVELTSITFFGVSEDRGLNFQNMATIITTQVMITDSPR
jgi:hypothetical protein